MKLFTIVIFVALMFVVVSAQYGKVHRTTGDGDDDDDYDDDDDDDGEDI